MVKKNWQNEQSNKIRQGNLNVKINKDEQKVPILTENQAIDPKSVTKVYKIKPELKIFFKQNEFTFPKQISKYRNIHKIHKIRRPYINIPLSKIFLNHVTSLLIKGFRPRNLNILYLKRSLLKRYFHLKYRFNKKIKYKKTRLSDRLFIDLTDFADFCKKNKFLTFWFLNWLKEWFINHSLSQFKNQKFRRLIKFHYFKYVKGLNAVTLTKSPHPKFKNYRYGYPVQLIHQFPLLYILQLLKGQPLLHQLYKNIQRQIKVMQYSVYELKKQAYYHNDILNQDSLVFSVKPFLNNLVIYAFDQRTNHLKFSLSAGAALLDKKENRTTQVAYTNLTREAFKKIQKLGFKKFDLRIITPKERKFGYHFENILEGDDITINQIVYCAKIAHNGIRARKKRRV